jgi:hypothetical protein
VYPFAYTKPKMHPNKAFIVQNGDNFG